MAPSYSRHLLSLTVPTAIAIFGFFWYRRKRLGSKETDPGEASAATSKTVILHETAPTTSIAAPAATIERPAKFARSLSGVDTAPIDIVIPPKLRGARSNPVVISDEDLELEIKKLNMIKFGGSVDTRKSSCCCVEPTSAEHNYISKKVATPPTPSPPPVVVAQTVEGERTPVEDGVTVDVVVENGVENDFSEKDVDENDFAENDVAENDVAENDFAENDFAENDFAENDVAENDFTKNNFTHDVQAGSSNETGELQRPHIERDSANHSPVNCAVSPSPSSIPDNQSVGSNDSGKGKSESVTPPPLILIYEFAIPQQLVGKLIGKKGSSVANIKNKTGAHVIVRKHPEDNKLKVCTIEGSDKGIQGALKMIRDKFPLKRFPEVTLDSITFLPPRQYTFEPHYVKLFPCINNDTIISHIVAPNHLFMQQPSHPSYPLFNAFRKSMNRWYMETHTPLVPKPVTGAKVCVALLDNWWHRAIILETDDSNSQFYVRLVDCGGYAWVEHSNLRAIKPEFLTLPFQAAECILANVFPINDEWTEESYADVSQLTKGTVQITQILDYTSEGIPIVRCFIILSDTDAVSVSEELVRLGHAVKAKTDNEAAGVSLA